MPTFLHLAFFFEAASFLWRVSGLKTDRIEKLEVEAVSVITDWARIVPELVPDGWS